MIRLTRYYHPSRNKKFPPFSPIHYASTKTLPVSLSVSATTISTVTTSNDTTTTATDFPNKNDGPSVYHYRCDSSSRSSSCRPILMPMPMPMPLSKSTTPNLNSNYLNHPNYAMPTLAFHSPPSYSFSTITTITTNTTASSTNTSSSSNSNASSKRRKKRKRHRASSKPSSPPHHQHSHDKTPNEAATLSHSHSNAHHTTSTSHKRVSRRRRKGIGSFPRPSSSSPSSFPKSPSSSSSSSSLFPNHNHNSNSWGKSKSKQRKEDYDYNPIRLHKMERRLTYLLTQYYSTLDISLPASAYALDSESNSDSESNFDSNSDSDLDHSHMSTTTNKTLPFYSSISTPQLASILLHPSLSSSSSSLSSSSSSSRVVVDYDKLLETETLYQQIQLTIRQIIIGWIKCNANSNGLSPSSPSSWLSSRPLSHSRPRSRSFHGKSPYEQSLLLPPLKSQNQIQTQTTHSSFQNNDNNNNNDHDVRAIHILRAQYPIRAEVWLDKMEELRWQRHQMVQHYVDLDTENKKGFWNQLTHKMAGMFSTTNHNDNDYNGGDTDPKKCQAHLTFAPTTSIYIQLLQAHRKSYFHKVHAQGGYGNETTLSSESSSSLSDASTSPLYKDNNNNKDKDNLLSFLSSHAITKRQENVLQKALVSQQRHNPHVNPNDYGMLLYKELLKQYAHNGTKAKDADRLCQQILAYRQQQLQQQLQQQQNEKEREEDMDNDDNDGSDNEEQDDRNNNNDDNTEDTSYSQIQSVFKRVNKDAYLIRLVMKAYARDCSSHPEHALRMEELLEDLKQLENSHTNRTSYTKLPPGSIANPEAYNLCFRAYQSAGWKAIPDMATRTQRLFHEISTTLWDNQSQSHRHNTKTTMYNHKKHKSLYGRHLERDLVEMYNRVMAIYTASRDVNYLHKAKSILQYMEKTYLEDNHKFQIPPNTRSFNTLLKGFINQRQQTRNNKIVAKLGTNMMKRMIYLPDAKPNEETYALLLQLWLLDSNGGSAEIGMQSEMIFSQLESDAMKLLSRHNHHHHYYNNTHMSGSGSGNGNAGTGNNHSIQWNGEGNPPNVDIKMYTRLIRNWRQSAAQNVPYAAQRAYDLLCRMEVESGRNIGGIDPRWGTSPFWDLGLTPDAKTYENVIAVCASTATTNPKDQDHALDIAFNTYHKMIQYGMKPDVVGILRCISQLVSPAQSRKRSMLAKKALEPVMMMMENDQEHHYHHGLINNAAKGALRKCSQEVYDDYYGDNNDDDDVDSLGEKNPELT